ncbi:MAG: hypothetical protein HOQ37_16315 [Cupriavidus sp.]|nr:hypothetical protein [Cupriavidus sp.]
MRDAADNVTGELLPVEAKRRPGRPRKPGAMTNAERQAKYRARLKADGISTYAAPGVPDLMHQGDADELAEELAAVRAELAEAHETIDELNDELIALRRWLNASATDLDAERKRRANFVTPKPVTKKVARREAVTAPAAAYADSDWPFPMHKD